MSTSAADRPDIVAMPPLLFLLGLVAGFGLHWAFPVAFLDAAALPWLPWLGAPLLALGFGLGLWGERAMKRAGTHVNPKEPATAIVTDGPFRFTRNPLYLALGLIFLGIAWLSNALGPLLALGVVLIVVDVGVVRREERYLESKFGQDYRAYKCRVRRWL